MMNFCTLFDSNYISKGIALYLSIERYTDDFTMYVMAMDRNCQEKLISLNFRHAIVECIEDNMSEELIEAKNNRSRAEFCWTCGSFTTYYFLTEHSLCDITYLDSDLMFFCSPKIIFEELEFKNASVGLSPHFTPYCASGKYCVQYCYFKNDKNGIEALTWWKNECIKWCYSRIENGKYADQLYLTMMPNLFDGVVDISNRGAGIANWNSYLYKFSDNHIEYNGVMYPVIFFHYSGFNINICNNQLGIKECFEVNQEILHYFLSPYLGLLELVFEKYLGQNVESIKYQRDFSTPTILFNKIDRLLLQFDWWHWFKAFLITLKYKHRHSPYSEKK